MRDPARIPRTYWRAHPDLRLAQILVNFADARPNPLFYVEDDVIFTRVLGEVANRRSELVQRQINGEKLTVEEVTEIHNIEETLDRVEPGPASLPDDVKTLLVDVRAAIALAETAQWECKVCGATPDEEGRVQHGKGCYMLNEDGGGEEHVG